MNGFHVRRFRDIPPMQYLQGFEAAARLGSFSLAADELGLTQSAVSHQMRALEERFGQPLFLRVGRQVHLTDAGRDYRRTVADSLAALQKGQQRLAPYANPASVVIYAPRDFSARWLMPRLGAMLAQCPGAEPWLDTSGRRVDFSETEASIAIELSDQPAEGDLSVKLGDETLAALASPGVARRDAQGEPVDLLQSESTAGWDDWLDNRPVLARRRTLTFSDADLALAAAEDGVGVALACPFLARQALDTGRLVPSQPETLPTGRAWIARTTERELANEATASVWAWLRRHAA